MTKLYKLTDQSNQTYGGCQWGEGAEHTASGEELLCGPGWLHAYTHPLLAVLLNPIHANIKNPILWEAEGDVGLSDGLKVGCRRLKTIHKIELPKVSLEQWVKFAILCAKKVCRNSEWNTWADNWLSSRDRSCKAARAAASAAAGTAMTAAKSAAESADWVAARATSVAAARATYMTKAWAADAAVWAAKAATMDQLSLSSIAEEAMK